LKFRDCGRHVHPNSETDLTLSCVESGHLTSTFLSY
jgi:hypothetical protein